MMYHKLLLTGLVTIVACMSSAGANEKQPFQRLEGEIQARLAGLDFAVMTFRIELKNSDYIVETHTESDGVASVFWNYNSHVRATGVMEEGQIHPVSYDLFSHYWNTDRTTALEFGPNGEIVAMELNPSPEEDEREAVPAGLAKGSTDPASIFLRLLAHQQMDKKLCTFDVKLFDGYRLNRLAGKVPDKVKDYPGNAAGFEEKRLHYCQADAEQLAGRRLEQVEKEKLGKTDDTRTEPADIWFGVPQNTSLILPVWVQKETSLGLAEFRLQNLRITHQEDDVLAWTTLPVTRKNEHFFPDID